jgi:hypothetical protein
MFFDRLFIYVLPLENKINQKERIRTNDIVYICIAVGEQNQPKRTYQNQ